MATLASDDFNRANESPIGGNWTVNLQNPGSGNLYLTSNQLVRAPESGFGAAWWNPETFPADHEALATISAKPADNSRMEIYTRLIAPGTAGLDGYMMKIDTQVGTDMWRLWRIDNNSETYISGGGTPSGDQFQEISVGDVISLKCAGSAIQMWYRPAGVSPTLIQTVPDATYPLGGYVGLGTDSGGGWDDFSVTGEAAGQDTLVARHGSGMGHW